MPSNTLTIWRNDRWQRLMKVDGQCSAVQAQVPADPALLDENLRSYVVLTCAHFQGFCRDLYTECTQIIADAAPRMFRTVIQRQFSAKLALAQSNASEQTISEDFNRIVIDLDLSKAHPRNRHRLNDLRDLNRSRNIAAHHIQLSPGTSFPDLTTIRRWKQSCGGLADSLDEILYNELCTIIGSEPWAPWKGAAKCRSRISRSPSPLFGSVTAYGLKDMRGRLLESSSFAAPWDPGASRSTGSASEASRSPRSSRCAKTSSSPCGLSCRSRPYGC